jgi:hypothetical protein
LKLPLFLTFITLLLLAPFVKADYCDLNLNPVLYANFTLNATKLNSTFYQFSYFDNSTNQTINYLLKIDCNQTKTFFLIPDQTQITTQPNQTINFNFKIAPVALYTNYTINSWGLFDINSTTIENLSDVYFYNSTLTFPTIPSGLYYQTFEVSNGLQTQYIIFEINNTLTLNPIIMKFDYPTRIAYGKFYNVSLIAENLNEAIVEIAGRNFTLTNTTQFAWEGKIFVLNSTDKIKLIAKNDYAQTTQQFDILVDELQFPISNIILPAVALNQSSKILLFDFGVDMPIDVNCTATIGGNSTSFDYYITDEDDRINPTQAKKIYLILNPKQAIQYVLFVNISSPYFPSKSIKVEFLGSALSYPSELDINYYDKPTHCKLVGDNLLNSFYVCNFTLPYNTNPENLQSNEIKLLKDGYEMKIDTLDKEINNLTNQRLILIIVIAIAVISFVIYLLKDKIMLFGGGM